MSNFSIARLINPLSISAFTPGGKSTTQVLFQLHMDCLYHKASTKIRAIGIAHGEALEV